MLLSPVRKTVAPNLRVWQWLLVCTISMPYSELWAQKPYFQQEVNCTLRVTLDDRRHMLLGEITIEYTNRSPDTLNYIYFHLYPNAYRNNQTAYARQKLADGSTRFYYLADSLRGFIDSLSFAVNGLSAPWQFDSVNIDIARVWLPIPLLPNKKAIVTTPFRVQIPQLVSRMGRIGQQYQISQWYPKPAVYDRDGWHPMPYLDQGEFYSEFGNYDVRITVPANYVVAATGVLLSAQEQRWLDSLSQLSTTPVAVSNKKKSTTFPVSDSKRKTLHYRAERVHDFAWFADKRYVVRKSSVRLPRSGSEVTTWCMFLPESASVWEPAVRYVDSALWYYSLWIGDYPYPQATAVQGDLLEGAGGMEYPMITVVSVSSSPRQLEMVIAHEVGHNWFYGVLAFNERRYPWLDEGINSYYEQRYREHRFPDSRLLGNLPPLAENLLDLAYPQHYAAYLPYSLLAARRLDQAASEPADRFTPFNYFAIVYLKVAIGFAYLEMQLGRDGVDRLMQGFFAEWKFRHPGPEDLKAFFTKHSGKELDWFFDQYIGSTSQLDYRIVKENQSTVIGQSTYTQLVVQNKGQVKGPFTISAWKNGQRVYDLVFDGFHGTMPVLFPEGDYDYFRIDPDYRMPEINRKNNFLRRRGLLRTIEPLRLQPLASLDNPQRTQIFFTPLTGYNAYDGMLPGLAMYNYAVNPKRLNLVLLPQFGVRSQDLCGLIDLRIPLFFPSGFARQLTWVSNLRSYHYSFDTRLNQALRFVRLHQYAGITLRKKNPRARQTSQIEGRATWAMRQEVTGSSDTVSLEQRGFGNASLDYVFKHNVAINPYQLRMGISWEHAQGKFYWPRADVVLLYGEGIFQLSYPRKKAAASIRVYATAPLVKPTTSLFAPQLAATAGPDDDFFDDLFLARSDIIGWRARQIYVRNDGGFRMRTEGGYPRIGESRSWMFAANVTVPLPSFPRLFAFGDLGLVPPVDVGQVVYSELQYTGGIGFALVRNLAEIYLPLIFSPDIRSHLLTTPYYDQWHERITFTLRWDLIAPFRIVDRIVDQ